MACLNYVCFDECEYELMLEDNITQGIQIRQRTLPFLCYATIRWLKPGLATFRPLHRAVYLSSRLGWLCIGLAWPALAADFE
jgi:hypothetical protein